MDDQRPHLLGYARAQRRVWTRLDVANLLIRGVMVLAFIASFAFVVFIVFARYLHGI